MNLLLQFLPYILGGLVAMGGAFGLIKVGQRRAEAKQARERLAARTIADEVDDAVAGRAASANRDALKQWGPK